MIHQSVQLTFSFDQRYSKAHQISFLGLGPLAPESKGIKVRVQAGDVIVISAGVAHCSQTSHDYQYIGAYPNASLESVTGQFVCKFEANDFYPRVIQNGETNTGVTHRE